ncbi:hypothetical protein AB838_06220 [Rhodobacteraceae bacterium (ex Bugula neritina AB1)]|nr:hypothetical protein AB838_06220 [Rhodobacteraceae bacterium (ex Bugula neritina AB1)]
MGLMQQPGLEDLFSPGDHARVRAIQELLSPDSLDRLKAQRDGIYQAGLWQELGAAGLFSLMPPPDRSLTGVDAARAVAMMSDALCHDHKSELDLAIYVHGLVAALTLHFARDVTAAAELLGPVQRGEVVFCTAYTDRDPAHPAEGRRHQGGFLLSGRKWLSVNMPHADFSVVTFQSGAISHAAILPLRGAGLSRSRTRQSASGAMYSQGALEMDSVFVPQEYILSSGLQRLRVWNRVMTLSRLLNAVSAARLLGRLRCVVEVDLAGRQVLGTAFSKHPAFMRWKAKARARHTVLQQAITATLRDIAGNRFNEAQVAGFKALAIRDAFELALNAQDMAGGAGTLAENEIAQITHSLSHHKFSSGGEAQLMSFFGSSLPVPLEHCWPAPSRAGIAS